MAEDSNYFSSLGSGGFAADATSAGLSMLAGAAGNFIGGTIGNYFGRKQSKQSFSNYKKQALYDLQLAYGPYFDLARKYDEKNYALARRYSENSASWARRGLENAGLNPILAASQGFNANMGFQGQQIDPTTGSTDLSVKAPSMSRIDPMAFASLSNTARQVDANVKQSAATTENIKAQTLKTLVDAINEYHSEGGLMKAVPGAITRLFGSGDRKLDEVMRSRGFDVDSISTLIRKEGFAGLLRELSEWNPALKLSEMASDWIRSFVGDRDTSRDAKTSSMRKDVSTAKDLADVVSPSPVPVVLPVKTHANRKKHRKVERVAPNPLLMFH